MARVSIDTEILTDIADSIRAKNHETSKYYPQNMPGKIDDILVPSGELEITANGTYDVTQYASASVSTPGITPTGTINITSNGTTDVTTYASANVNVTPNWTDYYATLNRNTSNPSEWWIYTIKKVPYFNVDSSLTSLARCFEGSSSYSVLEEINFVPNSTVNITNFSSCFMSEKSLKKVTGLNTTNAQNMTNMFYDCYNLETIEGLTISDGSTISGMFTSCSSLSNAYMNSFDYSKALYTSNLFMSNSGITSIGGDFTASLFTGQMFQGCINLATIGDLKIPNTTNSSRMFQGCTSLASINSITGSATNTTVWSMFKGCTALTSIPSFTTSGVTNFAEMCNQCTALTTVPVFDFSSASGNGAFTSMFSSCGNLSDTSLNNIMLSCITCGSGYTGNKTATALGLNATQKAKLSTLSAYNDFVTAGWSAS